MSSSQPGAISPSAPGQVLPVVNPPPAGSNGSIYQNGNALTQQSTDKLGNINKLANGGSRRKKNRKRHTRRIGKRIGNKPTKRSGGAINVAVPQTSYPQQGVGDQSIEGITTNATKVGTTTTANQAFDGCIGQPASCTASAQTGGRKFKRGGVNVKWGCMSGGRRSRKRRIKRTRKKRTPKRKNFKKNSRKFHK